MGGIGIDTCTFSTGRLVIHIIEIIILILDFTRSCKKDVYDTINRFLQKIFFGVSIVYYLALRKKIFFTPKLNKIVKSYAIFPPLPSPFEMNAVALVYFFRSHW